MNDLKELAIDWARIESWCEMATGKAICRPVLERVREAGRQLERERGDLIADVAKAEAERDELITIIGHAASWKAVNDRVAELETALRWVADNYPKAMREMPTELYQPLRATPNQDRNTFYGSGKVWTAPVPIDVVDHVDAREDYPREYIDNG